MFAYKTGSAQHTSWDSMTSWRREKVMKDDNVLTALKCLLGFCEGNTLIYDLEDQCSDIIYEMNQIWKILVT